MPPTVCRSLYSPSRAPCKQALTNPDGQTSYLGEPPLLAGATTAGVVCVLHRKRGLDVELVELGGALLCALDNYETALDDWIRGGSPFSRFLKLSVPATEARIASQRSSRVPFRVCDVS